MRKLLQCFFTVCCLITNNCLKAQTTTLIFPVNNVNTFSDSILFSWNILKNTHHYELEIADDALFSSNVKSYKIYNAKGDTTLTNFPFCKRYYWHVRAYVPLATAYSPVYSFSRNTPACVPDLELWQDAGSGVSVNGSQAVTYWQDRSGKNRHAVPVADSARPQLIKETSPFSNKCSFVRLDGIDDHFRVDSNVTIASFFSVFNWKGASLFPSNCALVANIPTSPYRPRGLVLVGYIGTTDYYIDTQNNLFSASEIEVDGVSNTTSLAPLEKLKLFTGISNSPAFVTPYWIGRMPNYSAGYWKGDIGDLIGYSRTLTASEKLLVQTYLNDKYAPPVNLGSDQIACSFPFTLHAKKDYYVNYKWQDNSTADSLVVNAPGTYYLTTTNVFGRISSDTIEIIKDLDPYVVKLGNDTCTNKPFTLTAGPSYFSYQWSTGALTNKIDITSSGTYWVEAIDCNGSSSKDTIKINIQALPVFSFGQDKIICYNVKDTLDPGFSNSLNYSFLWSDNSTDSILVIEKEGNYSLAVKDNDGCIYKDTISILVDSSLYIASLGPDTSMCEGNLIYLKTGASAANTYLWSDASTNSSLSIHASGQYFVTVGNSNGCFKKDTINVIISGTAPTPLFSANNVCHGTETKFTDSSLPPANASISQYTWEFGNSAASGLQNPTYTYADSGTYLVKLTVKASNNCEAFLVQPVKVYPNPKADFTYHDVYCDNRVLEFKEQVASYGYAVTQWKWNFSDPVSSSNDSSFKSDPVHLYSSFGTYPTRLIVITVTGCSDTIIKNVDFKMTSSDLQAITPKMNYNVSGDSLKFKWSIACGAHHYELEIADDALFSSNVKSYKIYNAKGDTTLTNFPFCKRYYWHVRAYVPLATAYSPVYSFSRNTPACVPDLELWQDAGSGVSVNGSQAVTYWQDRSGKNRHAVPVADSARPQLIKETSPFSNKCSFVRLDGIDDHFRVDSNVTIASFFSVFNWKGASLFPSNCALVANIPTSPYRPRGLVLVGYIGTTDYYIDTQNNLFSASEIEVDGVSNTTSLAPLEKLKLFTGISNSPAFVTPYWIGRMPNYSAGYWKGDIGDLIGYSRTLTASEKLLVQTYLNDKYAPPVNLGSDQIACSFPFTLHAKKDYYVNYKWQDNSTADSLVVNAPGTYYLTTTNVFGRISSDTVVIKRDTVHYKVNLAEDQVVLCQGQSIKLTAGPSYFSYQWSTGETSSDIVVQSSGTYFVSVKDCSGQVSTDSVTLIVHPLPVFSLGNDRVICDSKNYVLDPGFPDSQKLTFDWFDNTHDSIHLADYTGTFYLKVTSDKGCIFSDTVELQADSLIQLASLGPDVVFCAGNPIYLTSGQSKAVEYLWSTGSTADSISVITSGNYWVQVKSINNCVASDSITVTISGIAPTANFNSSGNCLGKSIQFTDVSVAPAGKQIVSWLWEFGDNTTSADQHPLHVYSDSLNYPVKLTVTTDDGCVAQVLKNVKMHPNPKSSFTVSSNCEQAYILFTNTTDLFGNALSQWRWNFGDTASGTNNTSLLKNPVHKYTTAGNYGVQLVTENGYGCADTLLTTITIIPSPVADFESSVACRGKEVQFTDKSIFPLGVTVQNSYWNFGDNLVSTLLDVKHTYYANVVYNVLHVVTASNGCKDSVLRPVTVNVMPSVYFSQSKVCEDTVTQFNDLSVVSSGSITKWLWKFNNTDSAIVKSPGYVFTNAGNAKVVLYVTTDKGCSDSLVKTILVNPKPLAAFTYTPTYGNPKLTVTFTNTSTGAQSYLWDFDDGTTGTLTSPVHAYSDTGTFRPVLMARNSLGCSDTASGIIHVLKRRMDVAIGEITTSIQNGYLNVSAEFINKGTADVLTMETYLQIKGHSLIRENWVGRLLKGATITNTFKTAVQIHEPNPYICISLTAPNGFVDENPIDNEGCKSLEESAFKILDMYPNPTAGKLTFPILSDEAGTMEIIVSDVSGRAVHTVYRASIVRGMQFITIETTDLNAGLYTCEIRFKEYKEFKKFIKN